MTETDRATRAGSFGAVTDAYDRARPGWPAAAIDDFWTNEPELQGLDSATLTWRSDVRRARALRNG